MVELFRQLRQFGCIFLKAICKIINLLRPFHNLLLSMIMFYCREEIFVLFRFIGTCFVHEFLGDKI